MTPTPGVNHVYRVVDAGSYAAVRDSAWIAAELAPVEERTTARPDWTYTGLYLYGRRTYVELFEAGPQGPVGHTGIAFSVGGGKTSALADAWKRTTGGSRTALVERPADGDGVPWFHLACAEPDRQAGVHLWSMEYHPAFLEQWHPDLTPARTTDPADVLDCYAARVTHLPRDHYLLDDIVGIDLRLTGEGYAFLRQHLDALGAVDEGPHGVTATLGVTTLRAAVSDAPRGLTSITCALRRSVPRDTRTFGTSTLVLDGATAVWTF